MCRIFCVCKVLRWCPCWLLLACTLVAVLGLGGAVIGLYWLDIIGYTTWSCAGVTCLSCLQVVEPSINLNSTVCTNIVYIPEGSLMSYTVSINETTIFNATLSVRNPPSACIGEPYVKKHDEACIFLSDISATKSSLHGCAVLETREELKLLSQYKLGCFDASTLKKTTVAKNMFRAVVSTSNKSADLENEIL